MATKANDFVHVPGDPRGWAPFEYLFRNRQQFLQAYDSAHDGGMVFCPTRRKLPVGFPVKILVRLGRRRPPLLLQGQVAWRRPGKHMERIRAGVGVEFTNAEQSKLGYVLDAAPAGDNVKSRRRHERIPLHLDVLWRLEGDNQAIKGTILDISRGGAFVRTGMPVQSDMSVILELAPPGAAVAMSIAGRIAWSGSGTNGREPGFGLEWRARDAGGGRRIRELVRRLTDSVAVSN